MTLGSTQQDSRPTAAPSPGEAAPTPDVLLVVSHLGHGGTQRVICNLANALSQQGFHVRVLLSKRWSNNALELDPAVEIEYLIYDPPRQTFAHLAGLYSLGRWLPLLRKRIREIGAPTVVSFIRPTNVKVLSACLGLKRQRIVICERNDPQRQPLGLHWTLLSWLLYRTADLVTFNSRGTRGVLARHVKNDRLVFLPNILAIPPAQKAETLAAPTILAVGRIVRQKGFDVLIRALAEAGAELAEWRIAFLGDGPEKQRLHQLAKDLKVDTRIEWHGHVADPFVFYRAASIFALPSRYEGTPNALLEAMSCGLPCIVSDASPGPLDLIDHGKNGLVVTTESVSEMTAALRLLAGNPKERGRMGAAAIDGVAAYLPEQALRQWKAALALPERPSSRPACDKRIIASAAAARSQIRNRIYLLSRQMGHYLIRPRIWPDLLRWLAKRIKDRIVGKDETAERARRLMVEATAWCAERAQSPAEILHELRLETSLIDLQQRFPEQLAEATARVETVPFRLGGASNMNLIYTLCEALQATRVIETGVANGWSSLAILLSITRRKGASLHSIDLPYLKYQNDPWVGIAVPEAFHSCWTLHRTADREGLPRALKALGTIDLAHYDSDKSPEGRAFAYPLLWEALRQDGILFSDDINDNFGFREFCDSIGETPIIVRQGDKFQGILRKP